MKKDIVNMEIRLITERISINTWSLYRREDGSYAIDIDNQNGTSGIYDMKNIEYRDPDDMLWYPIEGNAEYVKRNLRYADTDQLVHKR